MINSGFILVCGTLLNWLFKNCNCEMMNIPILQRNTETGFDYTRISLRLNKTLLWKLLWQLPIDTGAYAWYNGRSMAVSHGYLFIYTATLWVSAVLWGNRIQEAPLCGADETPPSVDSPRLHLLLRKQRQKPRPGRSVWRCWMRFGRLSRPPCDGGLLQIHSRVLREFSSFQGSVQLLCVCGSVCVYA